MVSPNAADGAPTLFEGRPTAKNEMPYYQRGILKAYRQGRNKIHFYDARVDETPEQPILFDLMNDAGEQRDIASENPDLVNEMTAAAETYQASVPVAEPIFDFRLRDAGL